MIDQIKFENQVEHAKYAVEFYMVKNALNFADVLEALQHKVNQIKEDTRIESVLNPPMNVKAQT